MTPLRTSEIATYLLLQNLLWLMLTWGAGAGQLWWPSLVAAAVLAAACWRAGSQWWRVGVILAVGLMCAFAVDGSLIKIRLVGYAGADPALPVPPLWIISLWLLFAATVALPARRLLTSPIIAGILGAVVGPLAYLGGGALGAIETNRNGLIVVGIFYALATPILVLVANQLLPVEPPGPGTHRRERSPSQSRRQGAGSKNSPGAGATPR